MYLCGIDLDDSNNIYLIANSDVSVDVWIGKFSSTGNPLWTKIWGGSGNDFAGGIALDSSNYPYITGVIDSFEAGGIGYQFILKLSNTTSSEIPPSKGDDDDDNGRVKDNIWLWLLIIVGSVSAIAATSLYYYHHRTRKARLTRKRRFQESNNIFRSTPSSEEILKKLYDKSYLLPIFETKKIKKVSAPLDNIHLTAVSNKFLRKLDSISVSIDEKREFLKEMMLFSPYERNEILDNILRRLNSNSEVK